MDSQIPRYVNKSDSDNYVHLCHIRQSVYPWLSTNKLISFMFDDYIFLLKTFAIFIIYSQVKETDIMFAKYVQNC